MFRAIRRARYRLLALLGVALAAGGALAGVLCWTLAAGLPPLDGPLAVEGIGEGVTIERDGAGIPTLTGSSRADLAFALGVCHAQDRLFQMDLMRRHTAGELGEIVGAAAAGEDARMRVHRFRARAKGLLDAAEPWERELIAAYARGVEAGRATLQRLPWEYLALQARWEPWREEDCLLVALGMYETLQHGPAEQERALGTVYDTLPPALADFLAPAGSRWDAALDGSVFSPARLPTPAEVDLRRKLLHAPRLDPGDVEEPAKNGSNNWAVSRRRTKDGRAIVACDMHLGLMVPGIWYRARLRHGGSDITGVTLPGAPAVVVGSNGHIAWGFTNAEADTSDLVIIEEAEGGYRTPGGVRPFGHHDEVIRIKGGASRTVSVEETIWGPVIGVDHRGRKLALRWVAHDAGSVNLRLMKLEGCRGVPEALLIAPTCGVPAQNFMVADDAGRIGWTILGRLPRRFGHDGRLPSSWADGKRGWAGFLPGGEHPRVFDPPDGVLWTANNRTVGGECATCVGFGSADPGARAGQIRDGLRSRPRLDEADMLAVQLDDRALFLTRWQGLLLETLADGPADVRMMVRGWGGRASPGSVGFRLVKRFRELVREQVLRELCAPCFKADRGFAPRYLPGTVEDSIWAVAGKGCPPHLRPAGAEGTHAEAAVRRLLAEVGGHPGGLAEYRQGQLNRGVVRHPLSGGLGPVGRWMHLDMPEDELPGDSHGMPRVQGGRHGASQRMGVAPGHEDAGYFHTPAGQSGHFLSKFYAGTHADWVAGKATPFLPGATAHTLRLEPRR